MDMNLFFIEALDLREHPIKKAKTKIRAEYITALSYIVNTIASQTDKHKDTYSLIENVGHNLESVVIQKYTSERLKLYQTLFFADVEKLVFANTINEKVGLRAVTSCVSRPWRKKYRLMLVCDVALILLEKSLVTQAITIINGCLSNKNKEKVNRILLSLFDESDIDKKHIVVAPMIKQYRLNRAFLSQKERRIIVTANMSAGKSTLINALIGKPLARTSQEVCTGNACYLFNKAFEDDNVHLATRSLTMKATTDELYVYEWSGPVSIASYFTTSTPQIPRMCIIDTPGVDAALYKEHTKLTHNALLNDDYDMVLYVVCPTNLGTDAETKHLKWVAQNIPNEKIVFVLNKLDNYRDCSDSIEESILGLKKDLLKIGFEDPTICPISAYFSYLTKLKMTGQILSADEADEYAYLSKKFMRSSYDLSHYYKGSQSSDNESEETKLSKRAGLYGLEKIIYGG